MRGMCSAMLSLQAVILALSIPTMIAIEDVDKALAFSVGGGLAILCVLITGMLRKPWAYVLGHLVQVATILMGFLIPVMFFVGAMFALLWAGAFFLGRRIEADKAAWAADAARTD